MSSAKPCGCDTCPAARGVASRSIPPRANGHDIEHAGRKATAAESGGARVGAQQLRRHNSVIKSSVRDDVALACSLDDEP